MKRRGGGLAAAGFAGELLPVEALSREGVLVTSDGAFIRVLEVVPRNPLVMSDSDKEDVNSGLAQMLARLPAGQRLQVYVESAPVRLDDVLAGTRRESRRVLAELEGSQNGAGRRADALRRLALAHEESVSLHAEAHRAVRQRSYLIVPYVPDRRRSRVNWRALDFRRGAGAQAVLARSLESHRQALRESLVLTEDLRSNLEALDFPTRLLDGPELAQLLYRRFNPSSGANGRRPRLETLGALDERRELEDARRAAVELRDRIAESEIEIHRPLLRVERDLEQTVYVSTTPDATYFGWLLEALQIDRPFTLTVHVHALDRLRERRRQKARYRRLWGVNRGAEQQGKVPDAESHDQEQEVGELLAELRGQERAGLYRVSIYQSVRQTGSPPNPAELLEGVEQAARAITAESDAGVQQGAFMQRELWQSTLPLGQDLVDRQARRYVSRNVADTLPLVGTSCGSPDGLPLFLTDPGATIESFNPFDEAHENHAVICNGVQGSGKTTFAITVAAALCAYGVQVSGIDRSGHYAFLCDAIPGARHLTIGAEASHHSINPWDTPDPLNPSPEKVPHLLALHSLLIGDQDADGRQRRLDATDRSLLEVAIRAAYVRASRDRRVPLERDLKRELEGRAERETDKGATELAARLRNLAERLAPFVAQGSHAFLCDRPTDVPVDSPLVVFDTRRLGDDLAAAGMFVVFEHVVSRIEAQHAERLARGHDDRLFPGAGLFVDETWQLMTASTGGYLNDVARRSRHRGMFLLCMTQHLGDLDNQYGQALLRSASQKVLFRQSQDELGYVRDALGLSDEEVALISRLRTAKRRHAQAYWLNGTRGRARVQLRLSPTAYWLATSEPTIDVPRRAEALRRHNGDVWAAIDELAREGVTA